MGNGEIRGLIAASGSSLPQRRKSMAIVERRSTDYHVRAFGPWHSLWAVGDRVYRVINLFSPALWRHIWTMWRGCRWCAAKYHILNAVEHVGSREEYPKKHEKASADGGRGVSHV